MGHSCDSPFGLLSYCLLVTNSFSGPDRMDNLLKDHRCPILSEERNHECDSIRALAMACSHALRRRLTVGDRQQRGRTGTAGCGSWTQKLLIRRDTGPGWVSGNRAEVRRHAELIATPDGLPRKRQAIWRDSIDRIYRTAPESATASAPAGKRSLPLASFTASHTASATSLSFVVSAGLANSAKIGAAKSA